MKAEYEDSYGNSASPKTPEEAFFASEETEAVPVESKVFCRNGGVKRTFTTSHFSSTAWVKEQQHLRKEPYLKRNFKVIYIVRGFTAFALYYKYYISYY
ncbi:hypothetical protein [Virgibacillus sp. DJP39]|uniref:hypothetical protein n=1 Tax=Virgibacillus sp. DJP39 TaxID=3409790 RepID=UPI003BB5F714